ncbi:hypothetical protein Acr_00g0029510 [Actinidia rufa]|uniref:Uncharacterized protein n=1 Tax=Actinidia rufa TaxID=165716 RepID=A0A7J0DEL4_9ERIC|nr:hypothetical protein Acr_00g0029510 [Actinidia rufa]
MEDEVTRLPSSPRKDPSIPDSSPLASLPSIEREVNIMTLEELKQLRESCSIPLVVLWRYHKLALSLSEFRNLFSLYKNPKLDSGWLYLGQSRREPNSENIPVMPRDGRENSSLSQPMAHEGGDKGKDTPAGEAAPVTSNKGMIKKEMRRILPHVPDLTLLRWSKGKRISLKKLKQKLEESKSESSMAMSTLAKGGEVSHAQKLASKLEGQLVEALVQEQQAIEELTQMKDARDATTDKLVKLELLVVELRESVVRSKKHAVEEFKSSDKFLEAIEVSAFKYFGEGFDFCKRQLCRHHPDLAIDLEVMSLNHGLLDEEGEEPREG